jgi:TM2 domain-containing membrane protein YozV
MNQPTSDAVALMRYDANKKSTGVTYLLWFFLGGFGTHRFYLGYTGSAIAILLITIVGVFLIFPLIVSGIWLLVDLFIIPSMTRKVNMGIAASVSSGQFVL